MQLRVRVGVGWYVCYGAVVVSRVPLEPGLIRMTHPPEVPAVGVPSLVGAATLSYPQLWRSVLPLVQGKGQRHAPVWQVETYAMAESSARGTHDDREPSVIITEGRRRWSARVVLPVDWYARISAGGVPVLPPHGMALEGAGAVDLCGGGMLGSENFDCSPPRAHDPSTSARCERPRVTRAWGIVLDVRPDPDRSDWRLVWIVRRPGPRRNRFVPTVERWSQLELDAISAASPAILI